MIDFKVSDSTKEELFRTVSEHNVDKFNEILNNLNESQKNELSTFTSMPGYDGVYLLHLVAKENQLEMLKLLLEIGVVKENADESLNEALFVAAMFGCFEVVIELLKIEAVINNAAPMNNFALYKAAKNGHLKVVQELLKIEAVRNNAATMNNYALRSASENGHLKVVQELLKIEAVRDDAAIYDNEALQLAAKNRHLEVVHELLKIESVRDNAAIGNNNTLRFAAQNGHLEIVKELLKIRAVRDNLAIENNTALWFTIVNGHLDVVQELLTINAVINDAAIENNRALYDAVRFGHLGIVQELLKIKAVSDNSAGNNNEMLRLAFLNGHTTVMLELLKIEVVRAIAAGNNNEFLRDAARYGYILVVQELLKIEGVRDNAAANDNDAFRQAAEGGYIEVVQELFKIEAVRYNAAAANNYALRYAAYNGHFKVVLELLNIDAVRDNSTANNNESLRLAAYNGHLEVVQELLKIEAVKDFATAHENYALRLAAQNGHRKVVKELMSVLTVGDYLLRDGAKQLIEILKGSSLGSPVFEVIFNKVIVYGLPLSRIIDRNSQTILEDVEFYCTHPESYLEQKINFTLSQRQAVRILKSYHDVSDYEQQQREELLAMEQEQNPDDEKKIAGVMHHFETVIEPKFALAFEKYGETLEERLQNVESAIRALLLSRIKEAAQVKQDLIVINFINNNFDALITGQDKNLMQEAREHFNSNVINEHVAWRVYDQWAPCVKEWPNLLTPLLEKGDEEIFSVGVLGKKVDANSASSILRKLIAVSFCLVIDESIENVATKQDRIENFIGQLKDIRRAHNEDDTNMDNPSCYPGSVSRAGLMWAMHSLALAKDSLELLPDVLKAKVASTFNMALEQCSDQAQRDVLFSALVMLRKENAFDVITEKADFSHEPDWALMRQAFINSLGTYGELWDEVNKELEAIGVENKLTPDQQVYLLQYLADIGGGWSSGALTSIYRQHDDKMEIEEEIIAQVKEQRQVSNPYCTFKGMPEKIAQMRAKQFAAWEIIYLLLEDHSDNATGELEVLAKVIVNGWVESESKLLESLVLNPFGEDELNIVKNNERLIAIVSNAYHVANTKLEEVVETAPLTTAYDNQKKRRNRPDGLEESAAKRAKNDDDVDGSREHRSARRL